MNLSLIHPRLFHGLALIEPVIQPDPPPGPNAALFSTTRLDTWPSQEAAEDSFRKNKAFKNWDKRALDQYLRYGLYEKPNSIPAEVMRAPRPVTLTTTKHQEAWTYLRSNFTSTPDNQQARLLAPDLSEENAACLFHRPEMVLTFRNLPSVRPNVLWLFGAKSYINGSEASRAEKVALTGIGIGGSGGGKNGKVESTTIEKGSHMIPFENVQECASLIAPWLEKQIRDFESVEQFLSEHDSGKSDQDRKAVSELWQKNVRLGPRARRNDNSRL